MENYGAIIKQPKERSKAPVPENIEFRKQNELMYEELLKFKMESLIQKTRGNNMNDETNKTRSRHEKLKKYPPYYIPILIAAIILFLFLLLLLFCFSENFTNVVALIEVSVLMAAALFGYDHLNHLKNRNMIETLENMNKTWNSLDMLVARKILFNDYNENNQETKIKPNIKLQQDLVNFLFSMKCNKHKDLETTATLSQDTKDSEKIHICNFFEELGCFLKKGIIDIEFMDDMYGATIELYYTVLEGFTCKKKKEKGHEKSYDNTLLLVREIKKYK